MKSPSRPHLRLYIPQSPGPSKGNKALNALTVTVSLLGFLTAWAVLGQMI